MILIPGAVKKIFYRVYAGCFVISIAGLLLFIPVGSMGIVVPQAFKITAAAAAFITFTFSPLLAMFVSVKTEIEVL